jgi:stage V sporulation protein SpoVS
MYYAKNSENEEKQFIGTVNVNEACVLMGVSRAITQFSDYDLVTYFMDIQNVRLIKQAMKIIIYSALCENITKLSHIHNQLQRFQAKLKGMYKGHKHSTVLSVMLTHLH